MHRRFRFPPLSIQQKISLALDDQRGLEAGFTASFYWSDWATEAHTPQEVAADRAFLQRLCDGQATAWRQLLELWSPRLYSYVFYNTHSDVDAQTLLQRAFALVVQRVMNGTQRPQSSSALSVLLVSTLYRSIIHYQQQMGVPALDAARYLQAFDHTHQHFIATLRELTPIVQQLLLLRYLVGLSISELALTTGYSASAVAVIVRAATQHFPPTTLR